jgi:hypothetical protein
VVAQRLIGDALPDALTPSLQPAEIDRLWARLQSLPEPPRYPRLGGHALGRHAGYLPWRTGLAMAAIGVVLVVLTIALGG